MRVLVLSIVGTAFSYVPLLLPKSLYISRAVSNFYGTEMKIWAGFGPIGNTEKKIGANLEQLLRSFFSCFQGQNEKKNLKIL